MRGAASHAWALKVPRAGNFKSIGTITNQTATQTLEFGKTSAVSYSATAARDLQRNNVMYQRILVAIDESATSEQALKEAAQLAKEQNATLRLVHVIDDTVAYTAILTPHEVAHQAELLRDNLPAQLLRKFGEGVLSRGVATVRALGVNAETTLLSSAEAGGRIYDSIEQEAARWSADLVVIGTHGRRGFRRLFLGSVAEGLIRITTKPVLLVRGIAAD